jgi:hypothetical protein
LYYLSRTDYERQWKRVPSAWFATRVLAILLKLFPKKGPFSALDFRIPTRRAEDLFVQSIDDTVASYRRVLQDVDKGPCIQPTKTAILGGETRAGEYMLSDATYAHLVDDLSNSDFKPMTPELRENVLEFYANPDAPLTTKRQRKVWKRVQDELQQLKETTVVTQKVDAPPSPKHGNSGSPQ